jgi:hypothetical protein
MWMMRYSTRQGCNEGSSVGAATLVDQEYIRVTIPVTRPARRGHQARHGRGGREGVDG